MNRLMLIILIITLSTAVHAEQYSKTEIANTEKYIWDNEFKIEIFMDGSWNVWVCDPDIIYFKGIKYKLCDWIIVKNHNLYRFVYQSWKNGVFFKKEKKPEHYIEDLATP